ncbi:MAG: hypothetical protein PHS64_00275 [Candidatus Omnitrophica bacterium]|nr:hypothetical protein [Candidatus Omnitrophota bacterium]
MAFVGAANDYRIKITTIDDVTGLERVKSGLKSLADDGSSQMERMKAHFESMKKNWLAWTAAIYAAIEVVRKAWYLMEKAAQFEQSKAAFHSMVVSMGADANTLLNELKEKSGGLIDNKALVESANRAMSLGIPLSKLGDLMEIARAKARDMGISATQAFNDIATGVGRASPLILDNLGLVMKVEAANQRMATSLGKTVEQLTDKEKKLAVLDATLAAGQEALSRYNMTLLTTKEKMEKLTATVNNLQLVMGTVLIRAFGVAMGALQGFAAACMTVVYGALKIGEAFTWVLSKLPGPHQAEWKASFDNMKTLSEAAWKTAVDLAQNGQNNIASAFAKSTDLASAMKQKLPGAYDGAGMGSGTGMDTSKLDKIKSLNEQIRAQTAKSELDERQHIQWQANEWRKAGADKILIQKWVNSEIAKLDEKQAKETIDKLEKAVSEWQKRDEERAIAQAQSNERLFKSRLDYEQKIDDYRKRSGAITDEEYTERKFDRERRIYQQQAQTLNVQLQQADTEAKKIELASQLEEIRQKIVDSYEYENFELTEINLKSLEKKLLYEQKIAQNEFDRLQFIGDENAALALQMGLKERDIERQYQSALTDPGSSADAKLEAVQTYLEAEYNLRQEYALKEAQLYWNRAQTYINCAQQMSTYAIEYLLAEGSDREVIGRKMLATSIRFLTQGLQQYMFAKAKEHLINAMFAAQNTEVTAVRAEGEAAMALALASAWLAFYTAQSLNPIGGEAFYPAVAAMAVAVKMFAGAAAMIPAIATGTMASELAMAAAWGAGGVLVGALGEAAASNIEGSASKRGTSVGSSDYYNTGLVTTSNYTATSASKAPVINIAVYGNVVDHDKFARELVPSITKAIKDGVE